MPCQTGFDSSVHLAYGDVTINSASNPTALKINLKSSKTDPFRKGVTVVIGCTYSPSGLCAVVANMAYMVARGPSHGAYFTYGDGKVLTRDRFVGDVRSALARAGVDASLYSGHSFRIGAATTAAAQGIPDSLIKTMGRWESLAYTLYIRTPKEQLQNVAKALVRE